MLLPRGGSLAALQAFAGVWPLEPLEDILDVIFFLVSFPKQNIDCLILGMKPATLRPFLPRPAIRRRTLIHRNYAIQAPGNPTLQVFDRHAKYLQKERAAANVERSRQVDYLKDEVAIRLTERLLVRGLLQLKSKD